MDWNSQKSALKDSTQDVWKRLLQKVSISGEESPQGLKNKHYIRLGMGAAIGVIGSAWALGLMDFSVPPPKKLDKQKSPVSQSVADLSTPLSSVKDGEIWVSRIEKLFKDSQKELGKTRDEHLLLEKRLNLMARILSSDPEGKADAIQALRALDGKKGDYDALGGSSPVNATGLEPQLSVPSPQQFPTFEAQGGESSSQNVASFDQTASQTPSLKPTATQAFNPPPRKKRKLLHLSGGNVSGNAYKSPETYLPAGTYFKVVTAMGVVVSTGTNSSSDPQPIMLRIVDNGNLPGGLKGKVKDAVLIGSCYGSASAERAICRLKTLSWRDHSGRAIEKPVEGWISSEDGVQGIRAKIIDRSSEVAREAFGAGLLSAASNFLKFEANSGVYPMSPFGQTNALSKTGALKGAGATGVGSALDKLAEFSIKRAESMSPVAYVSSGRILDAVLMTGVDLSPVSDNTPQLIATQPEPHPSIEPQGDAS